MHRQHQLVSSATSPTTQLSTTDESDEEKTLINDIVPTNSNIRIHTNNKYDNKINRLQYHHYNAIDSNMRKLSIETIDSDTSAKLASIDGIDLATPNKDNKRQSIITDITYQREHTLNLIKTDSFQSISENPDASSKS